LQADAVRSDGRGARRQRVRLCSEDPNDVIVLAGARGGPGCDRKARGSAGRDGTLLATPNMSLKRMKSMPPRSGAVRGPLYRRLAPGGSHFE